MTAKHDFMTAAIHAATACDAADTFDLHAFVAEVVREAAAYVVATEHGSQQRRLSRGVPFGHSTLHLRYDNLQGISS